MEGANKFGIEINLLTGRYVATFYNDRRRSEWPPHVARLFSALVAVWAEDGCDSQERTALEWLEAQEPPAIAASDAAPRISVPCFVPVNDTSIFGPRMLDKKSKIVYDLQDQLNIELASKNINHQKILQLRQSLFEAQRVENKLDLTKSNIASATQLFPEHRMKQERFYPSVTPDDARVTYLWDESPPDGMDSVLDSLLRRIVRLGHSSSLVSCRVAPLLPTPNYLPNRAGDVMRVIGRGQLAALEQKHAHHRGVIPRSLPSVSVPYGRIGVAMPVEQAILPDTAGQWIVFEFAHGSRNLPATRSVEIATIMRAAIFSYAQDPIPEEISGHMSGGQPTSVPHVAFLPIPYAGFEHADGRLLGIALSLPNSLSISARKAVLLAIGSWEGAAGRANLQINLGSGRTHGKGHAVGQVALDSLERSAIMMFRQRTPSNLLSLRPAVWQRRSRKWISVTPIALPKHPGRLNRGTSATRARAWAEAESSVADACTHVGLPRPTEIRVSLNPFIVGAYPSIRFPAFTQSGVGGRQVRRQLVHASVVFERPVEGPLMLGAGRFLGLGLMRPFPSTKPDAFDEANGE